MVFKSKFEDSKPPARFNDSLSEFFWHQLDVYADKTLIVDYNSGREWKGAQLKQVSSRIARYLVEMLNLKQNDSCVFFYPHSDLIHIVALGVLFAGGSVCVGARDDPADEHEYMIKAMKPKIVFTDSCLIEELENLLEANKDKLDFRICVINDHDDELARSGNTYMYGEENFVNLINKTTNEDEQNNQIKHKKDIINLHRHIIWNYGEQKNNVENNYSKFKEVKLPVQVKPDDPAFVLFTSGSTGRPKPVGRSHRNSIYVCYSLNTATFLWDLNESSVLAGHLQLDHGTGTFNFKMTLSKGLKLIVMDGYDSRTLLNAIEKYKITDCLLGSALLHNLISGSNLSESTSTREKSVEDEDEEEEEGKKKTEDYIGEKSNSNGNTNGNNHLSMSSSYHLNSFNISSLKNLLAVGSKIPSYSKVKEFMDKYKNVNIRQTFGMTETGFISLVPFNDSELDFESVGYILPNLKIKLLNPITGNEISEFNKDGELYVSGPTVSPGYIGNGFEEQSKQVFNIGDSSYYRSYDICRLTSDERLIILGRCSEILCLYDGWKVLPYEIEAVLLEHPGIQQIAVIGIPHPSLPTCHAPRAYVVPKDEWRAKLSEKEVFEYSIKKLSSPKHLIGGVKIMNKLPLISVGKVDKKLLRKMDGY